MDLGREHDVHINHAHRERRRAEKLVNIERFDESIRAHEGAIWHLKRVLPLANNPIVKESIQLQIAYHRQQQLIVAYKKERQQSLLRRSNSSKSSTDITELAEMAFSDRTDTEASKCNEIHRLLDDNAILLNLLLKKPKDSKQVNLDTQNIESLRSNNTEVRKLLDTIITDNQALRQRNFELQEEVEMLRAQLNSTKAQIPDLPPLECPDFENFEESTSRFFK